MADSYLHGSYGELGNSDAASVAKVTTLPVYVGTAPVHLLPDYEGKVNQPVMLYNFSDAVRTVGYSEDWESFTLCEAIDAHFNNGIEPIGPICFINVLDPETMRGTTEQKASVNLIGGRGSLPNKNLILKTAAIDGKVAGQDYTLDYDTGAGTLIVQSIGSGLTSPVEIKYYEVDPTMVTKDDVKGGTSVLGVYTGISAVNYVYQRYNMVPTLMTAPGWDHEQDVAEELKARAKKINDHWYAFAVESLTPDKNEATLTTIAAWKTANGYTDENAKCTWPCGIKNNKVYHLSTIAVVCTMQTDRNNRGIPYETPSNKPIDIEGLCFADGTPVEFDKSQATNQLNRQGITTAVYWGGEWRLWGPHTEKYEYNSSMDVRGIFDPYMRMLYYVINTFQLQFGNVVDKPMDRRLLQRILSDVREWMDGLKTQGALLYGDIQFLPEDNIKSDLVQGDFLFDIKVTATPPAKSITARVSYTDRGLDIYFQQEVA